MPDQRDDHKHTLQCERCGELFTDKNRRRVCRACSGRVPFRELMAWSDVAKHYTAKTGEAMSKEGARAIGAVAIQKLRRLIREDEALARDLGESGIPFESWVEDRE